MWWADWEREATPAQRADFAARGIQAPEFAKPQHTMAPTYEGQSYRQFIADEEARLVPERERARREAIATSQCFVDAQARKLERENQAKDAKSAELFREFHRVVANPPPSWSQANGPSHIMLHYAISRGVVQPNNFCWSDADQFRAIHAELHDPARMAQWGKK